MSGMGEKTGEKPYSYLRTPGGMVCIYRNGEKIAQIVSRREEWYKDAAFMVAALNGRHRWLNPPPPPTPPKEGGMETARDKGDARDLDNIWDF